MVTVMVAVTLTAGPVPGRPDLVVRCRVPGPADSEGSHRRQAQAAGLSDWEPVFKFTAGTEAAEGRMADRD